ncbi:DUF4232 domain-containing protein [Streptomyces sp. NBC_01390]|uniref:DUF4232 domain-containing protein n=1 Tax=Streptomyces sp. NBC_01390 TaxID=2903850 RepID=UPI00324DA8B7
MRVKKMPALALVVAAAALSLTACGSSDGSSASASAGTSTTASSSTTGGTSTGGTSTGGASTGGASTGGTSTGGQGSTLGSTSSGSSSADKGSTSASSSSGFSSGSGKGSKVAAQTQASTSAAPRCKTDLLAPSAAATGVKNEIVVNLKNTGSSTCSLHGFPGVQLIGPDGLGDTGPDAARTEASPSTVTIGPGEETRFLLRYIPDTSGSGKTYTRLLVTPPNDRVGEIVNLDKLAFTISASSGNAPDVYVDPVGYHVGSGK